MSTCQDFKTTFKHNLTCIFLSLKAKLKKNTLPSDTLYIPSYYLTKQQKGVLKIEVSRPKVDCKQQNTIDSTTKNLPNFTRTYIIFVEKRLTYCQGN